MPAPKRNIVLRLSSKEARVLSECLSDLSVGADPVVARISKALARAIDSPEETPAAPMPTATPEPARERVVEHHHHYESSCSGGGGEMVMGDYGPVFMSQASLDYMRSGASW